MALMSYIWITGELLTVFYTAAHNRVKGMRNVGKTADKVN